MSETITLGKSRKDGKWSVLVQPERPFGEHLDAYRKIASTFPVSDEYSRVVIGKIHHSSPALNLVSKDQAAEKAKSETARQQSVIEIVKSAPLRQAEMEAEKAELKKLEHDEAIAEKNAGINQLRKHTGQPEVKQPVQSDKK
jgi:hypothetical protein